MLLELSANDDKLFKIGIYEELHYTCVCSKLNFGNSIYCCKITIWMQKDRYTPFSFPDNYQYFFNLVVYSFIDI